jgi:hypothetical protein
VKKFRGRQPFVKTKIFRQEADLSPDLDIARRLAQHKGLATGGRGKAKKHFDGSALACAVRAEESEYLAPAHRQGQVTHRDFVAENLVQVLCLDRVVLQLGQS